MEREREREKDRYRFVNYELNKNYTSNTVDKYMNIEEKRYSWYKFHNPRGV